MTRGRKPKIDRPVEKTISISESLVAKVDLVLWSQVEGRVPHGAWSRYVEGLIQADLIAKTEKRATVRTLAAAELAMQDALSRLSPLVNGPNNFPDVNLAYKVLAGFLEGRKKEEGGK
jgi:hypothetical protein